jgi:hypothetical protein
MSSEQEIDNSSAFWADHVYTPEILLTSWFNLTFCSMTLAMVFYGIAIHKNLAHHALIALITIGLISLSIYYTWIGYIQYKLKLKYTLDGCFAKNGCSKMNLNVITNNNKYVTLSSMMTIGINLLIASIILRESYKKFTS